MFTKTIGILGGMGPVASADTYTELIKICQQKYGAIQDSEFPSVILYSLPLTNFDHKGFSNNKAGQKIVIKQLINGLKKLENAGADVIIIDCNTVHYFFNDLQKSVKVPIINLINITVEKVISNSHKKVALLCSQASKDMGLYNVPLESNGVEVINTSDSDQRFINDAILAVMSGRVASSHINRLSSIIDKFISNGAETVILGCTEISNIAKRLNDRFTLVDSELLAIEKALKFAKSI